MQHVHDLWFERVVCRPSSRDYLEVSHVLVVVTDLLTDLDITDSDALDYLETELRRQYAEANDIRFVPLGRGTRKGQSADAGTIAHDQVKGARSSNAAGLSYPLRCHKSRMALGSLTGVSLRLDGQRCRARY